MKVKHSKYKNTGILFELLTRQLTSDTILGGESKSLSFLKKHFNSKTELLKEYKIYHTLSTQKYKEESKANILINTLIESYKDGLTRYFSNQITNSDELKSKLELEKSINEVSFL